MRTDAHVVVLGGSGNFGARIVRALRADPAIRLTVVSRHAIPVAGADTVNCVSLDWRSTTFAKRLQALAPDVVIHCVGPFQGQDYRVARAALAADAHYVDLADGRDFVVEFAAAIQALAVAKARVAITGASTLPALSSAAIDHLIHSMSSIESIDVAIAPGQRAGRGAATLAAVFSYLGRPFPVWEDGRWQTRWGWMDVRSIGLDVGRRWGAACDVPDLTLLPARYPCVRTVRFHAALEYRLQHAALWALAGLRRCGLALPVDRLAMALNGMAALFDPFAGHLGGMSVSVVGERSSGGRVRRNFQLTAPAADGPEIPCFAAILLAQRLARGDMVNGGVGLGAGGGAFACVGMLSLADFAPMFDRWGIRTRIEEADASVV